GHGVDVIGVQIEGVKFLTGLRIPHFHRTIRSSAGQAFAIRAEGHAIDPAAMPLESEKLLAGLRIPYLHRLIGRSAGQTLAVRAKGHAQDSIGVSLKGKKVAVAQPIEIIPFEAAQVRFPWLGAM